MTIHSPMVAEDLDAIRSQMEPRGSLVVSLPQALADSAYSTLDVYCRGDGISWLHRHYRASETLTAFKPIARKT